MKKNIYIYLLTRDQLDRNKLTDPVNLVLGDRQQTLLPFPFHKLVIFSVKQLAIMKRSYFLGEFFVLVGVDGVFLRIRRRHESNISGFNVHRPKICFQSAWWLYRSTLLILPVPRFLKFFFIFGQAQHTREREREIEVFFFKTSSFSLRVAASCRAYMFFFVTILQVRKKTTVPLHNNTK